MLTSPYNLFYIQRIQKPILYTFRIIFYAALQQCLVAWQRIYWKQGLDCQVLKMHMCVLLLSRNLIKWKDVFFHNQKCKGLIVDKAASVHTVLIVSGKKVIF